MEGLLAEQNALRKTYDMQVELNVLLAASS